MQTREKYGAEMLCFLRAGVSIRSSPEIRLQLYNQHSIINNLFLVEARAQCISLAEWEWLNITGLDSLKAKFKGSRTSPMLDTRKILIEAGLAVTDIVFVIAIESSRIDFCDSENKVAFIQISGS